MIFLHQILNYPVFIFYPVFIIKHQKNRSVREIFILPDNHSNLAFIRHYLAVRRIYGGKLQKHVYYCTIKFDIFKYSTAS